MAENHLRIVFAQSAFDDLREMAEYWLNGRSRSGTEDLVAKAVASRGHPEERASLA